MLNNIGAYGHNTPYKPNSRLVVNNLNDAHCNLDNFASLVVFSKYVDDISRGSDVDVLKISAGDNWAGKDVKKNALYNSLLEYIGITVSAVGNHEFDGGVRALADKISKSKIQFVSANLDIEPTNPLWGKIHKSVVQTVKGTKYGIIGATTPDLMKIVSNLDDMKGISVKNEEDTRKAIREEVEKLHAQGVKRIILTSHCGLEFDQKTAQSISGIGVIVSGHSHDELNGVVPGKNYFSAPDGKPVIIVQQGANADNSGLLELVYDDNSTIIKAANTLQKNQAAKGTTISRITDEELGPSPIIANLKTIEPAKSNRRISSHPWVNLACDSMRAEMGTEIAFINPGNVRKIPIKGDLTERDVRESYPMGNKLLKTTMTEAEIVSGIRSASKSLSRAGGEPGILQVSGLRYKIDEAGNLLSLDFVDKNGAIAPINIQNPSITKTYSVCYDSFVGDGREYPEFNIKGRKVELFDYDKDTTLINYIKKMPSKDALEIIDDHRIEIVKTSKYPQPNSSMRNFLNLTLPKSA